MSHDELVSEVTRLRARVELMEEKALVAEKRRKVLAENEERYRALVELAADAILLGDPQGSIIGANHSALTLTGYTLNELLGKNITFLFSQEEQRRTPFRYDLLQEGKVIQNERMLSRKDGSVVAIAMNSKMMPDGTYQTFIRDISERKRLEEQMNEANRELEAFVYTVSHDLRTPLTLIIGYSDYLLEQQQSGINDHIFEILREIEKAGYRMLDLMEDVLSLAMVGHLERPSQPVAAKEVVQSVVDEHADRISAAGLAVHVGDLPSLHVPKSFLAQVFNNLIGNALRYAAGQEDPIVVGGERDGSKVRFFVRDRGRGIPEEERDRIFEVFYRGQMARGIQGTGVGLAIVQKVARTCGGKAWLEETPGGGCTFWVEMEDVPPTLHP